MALQAVTSSDDYGHAVCMCVQHGRAHAARPLLSRRQAPSMPQTARRMGVPAARTWFIAKMSIHTKVLSSRSFLPANRCVSASTRSTLEPAGSPHPAPDAPGSTPAVTPAPALPLGTPLLEADEMRAVARPPDIKLGGPNPSTPPWLGRPPKTEEARRLARMGLIAAVSKPPCGALFTPVPVLAALRAAVTLPLVVGKSSDPLAGSAPTAPPRPCPRDWLAPPPPAPAPPASTNPVLPRVIDLADVLVLEVRPQVKKAPPIRGEPPGPADTSAGPGGHVPPGEGAPVMPGDSEGGIAHLRLPSKLPPLRRLLPLRLPPWSGPFGREDDEGSREEGWEAGGGPGRACMPR